jgi:hypothetical protein
VRLRKAWRAAACKARDPRRSDQLGGVIGSEAISENSALQSVYDGRDCIEFLLSRGKPGIEAFDVDEHSLGIFPTLKAAADACAARRLARAARVVGDSVRVVCVGARLHRPPPSSIEFRGSTPTLHRTPIKQISTKPCGGASSSGIRDSASLKMEIRNRHHE